MSAAHWRETCRIKSFTVPYDPDTYRPTISFTFLSKTHGFQLESYDFVGALMYNGWPVKAKYVRRSKTT